MPRDGKTTQIGATIRSLRMAMGLAQQDLAQRAGISPALLSLWENGRREPTLSGLRKLASHLDVPARLLFAAALVDADEHAEPESHKLITALVTAAGAQLLAEGARALARPDARSASHHTTRLAAGRDLARRKK